MTALVLATSNPHKIDEIRAVLRIAPALAGLRVLGLREAALERKVAEPPEPIEEGQTFADNARIKARGYSLSLGALCLADDSGLEVDALGGLPGVHSAYYALWSPGLSAREVQQRAAGVPRTARDAANNERLLRELAGVDDGRRAARFVCAMCLCDPRGNVLAETRGTFEGTIGHAPRGTSGFGYDPLLILPDGRSSAELSPEQKNARSHRGSALRAMLPALREHAR